jgi:hypothetical protein
VVSQFSCAAAITGRHPIIDVLIRADCRKCAYQLRCATSGFSCSGSSPIEAKACEGDRGTSVTKRVYREELRPVITHEAAPSNEFFDRGAQR